MENKNWIYGGIFLEEMTKNYLISFFKNYIPDGWKTYCDHMTAIFHSSNNNQYIIDFINNNLNNIETFRIIGIGISEYAIAFEIETNVPSTNNHKHITLAVAPGHKPFESNNIINWKKLPQSVLSYGTIRYQY